MVWFLVCGIECWGFFVVGCIFFGGCGCGD